jgi:hypothetical protein
MPGRGKDQGDRREAKGGDVSGVRAKAPVPVAVAVSDLHAESRTPPARAEKDWYEVQSKYLAQLDHIAATTAQSHRLPILIAGDLFNRWNPNPELISFLIKHLPLNCYAVPGQHDLPLHSYEDRRRSGYWTLVEAKAITDLADGDAPESVGHGHGVKIWGFPWGCDLRPCPIKGKHFLKVALVHKLVWWKSPFPGASEDGQVDEVRKALNGFDVIVSGDNHEPFLYENLFNGGCFIRRRSDEIHRKPHVGIIYSDGSIKNKKLDVSEDKFKDVKWKAELEDEYGLNADDYVEGIQNVEEVFDDFKDVVRRYARKNDVRKAVGMILEQLLGDE